MTLSQISQAQTHLPGQSYDDPTSQWDQDGDMNVGQIERTISELAGVGLVALGLGRRSIGGIAIAALGAGLLYRGISGRCPLYRMLGMSTREDESSERLDGAAPEDYFNHSIHVEQCFTINRPADELYQFWRRLENLPTFMHHLQSVTEVQGNRSHWVTSGPVGSRVEWDAEIINDEPGKVIAWRSLANANVDNAGSVRFIERRDGEGTDVRVVIDYIPPAGRFGDWVAKLFGKDPGEQIREELCRFKQVMERGQGAALTA